MSEFYITLVIKYDDGAIQTWNYDGTQFNDLEQLKLNMASDFVDPRLDRKTVIIRVSGIKGIRSPFQIPVGDIKETEFVNFVFAEVDKRTK